MAIRIVIGDITEQQVDAIVNAANRSLLGGGGVDGAIHRAAGPALVEECSLLGGCEDGEAKITSGYELPSKYVIHTVGPIYGRVEGKEAELLAACYQNSLRLVKKHGLRSVAFPAISTGVFGYPKSEAALIVLDTVSSFLKENGEDIEVRFIFRTPEDAAHYRQRYARYFPDFLVETTKGRYLVVEVKSNAEKGDYEANRAAYKGKKEELTNEVYAKQVGFEDFQKVNKNFEYRIIFNAGLQAEQARLLEEIRKI